MGSAQPNQGGATEHCPLCSVGFSAPIIGMTDCEACDLSSYVLTTGATKCNACLTLDAAFGLAAPDQCMITWLILLCICIVIMCCCGFQAWCKGGCKCKCRGKKIKIKRTSSGYIPESFYAVGISGAPSPSPTVENCASSTDLLGSPNTEMLNFAPSPTDRSGFTHQRNLLEDNSTQGNVAQNPSAILDPRKLNLGYTAPVTPVTSKDREKEFFAEQRKAKEAKRIEDALLLKKQEDLKIASMSPEQLEMYLKNKKDEEEHKKQKAKALKLLTKGKKKLKKGKGGKGRTNPMNKGSKKNKNIELTKTTDQLV